MTPSKLKTAILALLLAIFGLVHAQTLTTQQRATLVADIDADPALAAMRTAGNLAGLAAAYNLPPASACVVWRTALSRHEILTGTSSTGTTFAWAGGAYITRSQGERDAFREMFNSTGAGGPGLASIQAAFSDIFSGTGGAGNRAHILALSKRASTRIEKLFATGACSDGSPSKLGNDSLGNPIQSPIDYQIFGGL